MTGAPLVNRVNAAMLRTVFEMSVGVLGRDGEPDPVSAILASREIDLANLNKGLFENLDFLA